MNALEVLDIERKAATGVIQAPRQAVDLAREYLNPTRAEKGGAA